jgi:hypothetical protein
MESYQPKIEQEFRHSREEKANSRARSFQRDRIKAILTKKGAEARFEVEANQGELKWEVFSRR